MPPANPAQQPTPGYVRTQPSLADIQGLAPDALVARFGRGVENFDRRLFALEDEQLDTAFRPEAGIGRWPVRVLLGHLADAEIVQIHRIRRTVAEDHPLLALWDENAFVDSGLYGTPQTGPRFPVGAFVAAIHTMRAWTREWLATLPPDAWSRTALHPERGEISVRTLTDYTTYHLEHHAWFLNRKIDYFLGPDTHAAH